MAGSGEHWVMLAPPSPGTAEGTEVTSMEQGTPADQVLLVL